MKTGARNNLVGNITEIKKGDLMSQVKVEINSNSLISSVMTIDSLEALDIKEGDKIKVIVKAVNVLLIKE